MDKRAFHLTVIDLIARVTTLAEFMSVGKLLADTKIPANHAAIRAAWWKKGVELNLFVGSAEQEPLDYEEAIFKMLIQDEDEVAAKKHGDGAAIRLEQMGIEPFVSPSEKRRQAAMATC